MKKIKIILINLFVIFIISCTILYTVSIIQSLSFSIESFNEYTEMLDIKMKYPDTIGNDIETIKLWLNASKSEVIRHSISTVCAFLCLLSSIFIFIYCNPKLFRRSTWTNLSAEWAQNKSERIAAKQAKAEAEKQKQIAELEQKLDELKKD